MTVPVHSLEILGPVSRTAHAQKAFAVLREAARDRERADVGQSTGMGARQERSVEKTKGSNMGAMSDSDLWGNQFVSFNTNIVSWGCSAQALRCQMITIAMCAADLRE